ncbi:unnamed protein product [Leuciscus chuanchicus]
MLILAERVILVDCCQNHRLLTASSTTIANRSQGLSDALPLSLEGFRRKCLVTVHGLDAYTFWLQTGIAHCHAHYSLQAQQRIATTAALSLSLPLSPPLPDKTPPLHLSVTPSLLHMICTSLPPS